MTISVRLPSLALVALALAGCQGVQSAREALGRNGPTSLNGAAYTYDPAAAGTADHAFEASFSLAAREAVAISNGAPELASYSQHARQAALDGVTVAENNCRDFFDTMSENQKWIWFAKDLIAAAGSVATGVIGLASHANATPAAAVALTTASAYNGVDIYTRNFLFGSDNIDQVRTLVINAMDEHKRSVFTPDAASEPPWKLNDVITVVDEHQLLCRPAKIKMMVLDAIKNGKVAAFTPSGQQVGANTSKTDGTVVTTPPAAVTAAPAADNKTVSAPLPAAQQMPVAPAAAATVSRHLDMKIVK